MYRFALALKDLNRGLKQIGNWGITQCLGSHLVEETERHCCAYAYDNRSLIWGSGLFNLQQLSSNDKSGKDLHVRVAASQLVGAEAKAKAKRNTSLIVFGAICGFFYFFGCVSVVLWRKRQRDTAGTLEKVDDSLAMF
ncbi:G-type lectin S-receptor-like serine/threonine-protein kinase [Camellia lanceoleosa]|uniref:G-type lectin S-receptor-like serine/threonine-protein kinase n=1 Tax=Camellia lanceoleosa TaxID=1840588 RepID=A0ACC0H366_9ERIC|nr:G-type lectin S-receptor-like serine/threonine-protein kinase [Camellia lanceoleosa]